MICFRPRVLEDRGYLLSRWGIVGVRVERVDSGNVQDIGQRIEVGRHGPGERFKFVNCWPSMRCQWLRR